MDKDKATEPPRRPLTRSQPKDMQAKVVGLQWEFKKMLIVNIEFETCEEELLSATYNSWSNYKIKRTGAHKTPQIGTYEGHVSW